MGYWYPRKKNDITKINYSRGDLTDISPTLMSTFGQVPWLHSISITVSVLIDTSVKSPRKLIISINRWGEMGKIFPFKKKWKQNHRSACQCFFLSRNIGLLTPKINYFYYLKNIFSGSKYPKKYLIKIWKQKHCSMFIESSWWAGPDRYIGTNGNTDTMTVHPSQVTNPVTIFRPCDNLTDAGLWAVWWIINASTTWELLQQNELQEIQNMW